MGAAMQAAGGVLNSAGIIEEDNGRQSEAIDNQRTALQAAADAIARGNTEAARARMLATQAIARQRVAFAASGVDASVGTAAEAGAATRMMSELDAQTLKNNAAREAWGFKTKARQIKDQAKRDYDKASMQAVSSILGGVANAAASSEDAKSPGAAQDFRNSRYYGGGE